MTTLLLSGWTQPIDALAHLEKESVLFDYSQYATVDEAIKAVSETKPSNCVAWSMGGQFILRAMAAGAIWPQHLTLIAAPYKFVSDSPELNGMDSRTFDLFRESYANDPERTAGRFTALLAKGDRDAKRVMQAANHHPNVLETARFLPWLDDLGRYSLDEAKLEELPPTLIIHGMNDAIVPYQQSLAMKARWPQIQLNGWEEVGHAPHLHDAERVRREIAQHRVLGWMAA